MSVEIYIFEGIYLWLVENVYIWRNLLVTSVYIWVYTSGKCVYIDIYTQYILVVVFQYNFIKFVAERKRMNNEVNSKKWKEV